MPKPYSLDLRERVVARVGGGEPVRAVAAHFGVSVSSVVRWSQRQRAHGHVAPSRMGGDRRPKIHGDHRAWLIARLSQAPFTLRGLVAEVAGRGVRVDYRTLWSFVHGQGLSFKKNRAAQRTGAPCRRASAHPLARASASDGSTPSALSR